jgi:glycosyltransferase involved in cell wall biosynthesis
MRIGVALCSFNGGRYIGEQLDSIAAQLRPADEVVVCDDGSSDDTIDVVREWMKASPSTRRLIKNQSRRGISANFEQAILQLSGCDVIVLSDQDDLWEPAKLGNIQEFMLKNPDVWLTHSDALLVDPFGRSLGSRLSEALRVSSAELLALKQGDAFKVLIRRNLVTGATCALRSQALPYLFPIGRGWLHDEWIALVMAAMGRTRRMNVCDLKYRQHATNAIGQTVLSLGGQWQLARTPRSGFKQLRVVRAKELLDHLRAMNGHLVSTALPLAEAKLAHAEECSRYPEAYWKRVFPVGKEFISGRYFKVATGWRGMIRDLVEPPSLVDSLTSS